VNGTASGAGSAGTVSIGTVLGVQVGLPKDLVDDRGRVWRSGFGKQPVVGAVRLDIDGLAGDGQADLRVHGGPDKAVCVYSVVRYAHWEHELGREHESGVGRLRAGAFGENLSVGPVSEDDVCVGDTWALGDAIVQVSQPRGPCWKLARVWGVKDLAVRFQRTGYTGWYLRVLRPGILHAGQEIVLQERPHPDWTVLRANHVYYGADDDERAELAACPALGRSWREKLTAPPRSPHAQRTRLFGEDSTGSRASRGDGSPRPTP
jgi:MOSC domain-containing protein YiiM